MAVSLPEGVVLTKLDAAANWARKNSLWPMPFATACCGIELMATASSRHDIARFGAEIGRRGALTYDEVVHSLGNRFDRVE